MSVAFMFEFNETIHGLGFYCYDGIFGWFVVGCGFVRGWFGVGGGGVERRGGEYSCWTVMCCCWWR